MTDLFNQLIFGPIISRRLGISLGINLLPLGEKLCNFDCLYCECGRNKEITSSILPSKEEVKDKLSIKLKQLSTSDNVIDSITFAGNGEPTLHPQFSEIIEDTIKLRDLYLARTKVSVLSNAANISQNKVVEALKKVENNILKLDSAIDETIQLINRPVQPGFNIKGLIEELKRFSGSLIIQSMFVRGNYQGSIVDNTNQLEVKALIEALKQVKPKEVMLYSINRDTAEKTLYPVSRQELEQIARQFQAEGLAASVW